MSDQASTIMVNTLEPQSGTTLTVGKSGQNLQVNADSLKANVAKDAGGNAVFTSDGSGNISGLNSAFGSAQALLYTTTVSTAVANISFTSGLTSTYKEYVFEFININPATDDTNFLLEFSDDAGSSFAITKTTTFFSAKHAEDNSVKELSYVDANDLAQSTDPQIIGRAVGSDSDQSCAGEIHLFNPASTTYVKNFYVRTQVYRQNNWATDEYIAGYCNTTSAINGVRFSFASGNINAGKIKMYGIS